MQTFPRKKKKQCFLFFPDLRKKKKTQIEKIELVSNPQTFPGKKKNTIPLRQAHKKIKALRRDKKTKLEPLRVTVNLA